MIIQNAIFANHQTSLAAIKSTPFKGSKVIKIATPVKTISID